MKKLKSIKYLFTTDIGEIVSNLFSSNGSRNYIRLSINFFIAEIALRIFGDFFSFLRFLLYPIESVLGQIGFLLLVYGVVLRTIDYFGKNIPKDNIRQEKTSQENLERQEKPKTSSIENYFEEQDLVEDGKSNESMDRILRSYYIQVLRQSSISFTYSLVFAAIGFIVIVFSIFPSESLTSNRQISQPDSENGRSENVSGLENNQNDKWPGLISGIVIEAVSALIFVQTNNARKTMIEFSEKIRLDRKLNESLELIDKIPNEKIQSRVKALLVLNFSGIVMKYDDQEILQQVIDAKAKVED